MARGRVGAARMALAGAATVLTGTVLTATALTATAATPADAAGPSSVVCTYQLTAWSGGFMANVSIDNRGPAIDGWTVRWTFREPTTLVGVWSADLTLDAAGVVSAKNTPWNGRIGTAQTTSFGWSAVAATTSVPTDVTINGQVC